MASRGGVTYMFIRIVAILLLGAILVQPTYALAAEPAEAIHSVINSADMLAMHQQNSLLRIGVLYPQDGATAAYSKSLQTAIEAIRQQIAQNDSLPRIEFIRGELTNNESENGLAINKLVALGVDAIVAPNLLSALITASPGNLDITPLVSKASRTLDLAFTGESSLYSNLSEHSVIVRTIQKLKLRGRLEQVVLMYDPADIFGRFGYEVAVDVLSSENASFSTEIFNANSVNFFAKLEQVKLANPRTTVIIVGKTEDVADVISQAHDQIGLSGSVLGFIGDGNPAIYDLADKETNQDISGVAWDVVPTSALSNLVAEQFTHDRFAAETYIAIWTLLLGVDEDHPPSRAGVRNAFIDHRGNHLEAPSTSLAGWLYHTVDNSIQAAVGRLSLPQIGQLDGLVTTDLQ